MPQQDCKTNWIQVASRSFIRIEAGKMGPEGDGNEVSALCSLSAEGGFLELSVVDGCTTARGQEV